MAKRRDQFRPHDRTDFLWEEGLNMPRTREGEVKSAYGQIDAVPTEPDSSATYGQMKGNVGMGALKPCQSWDQPAHCN